MLRIGYTRTNVAITSITGTLIASFHDNESPINDHLYLIRKAL